MLIHKNQGWKDPAVRAAMRAIPALQQRDIEHIAMQHKVTGPNGNLKSGIKIIVEIQVEFRGTR
jgi:hypothetical protein